MTSPLWQPNAEQIANTELTRFTAYLNNRFQINLNDYEQLHTWSVQEKELFWSSIWDYFKVIGSLPTNVLEHGEQMLEAKWFVGGQLNFAENLLKRHDDAPAIIETGEDGRRHTITYAELRMQVAQLAAALKAQGVVQGDRIAGFLPNCAASVIAMLATASLGAVWSSCSPDFGLQGVIDRFGQIEPKVLFATNGYYYNGKAIDTCERVSAITENLPSLKKLVMVPYLANQPIAQQATALADFMDKTATQLSFVPVSFDAPLYIMYSSGTTGAPKCIVHSVGGTLLQHLKELALHSNVQAGDKFFYYSTCGWMMWNWHVSGLALGATLVLYDGSPFYPSPTRLYDLIDQENISIFGASAKFYAACEKADLKPKQSHKLEQVRCLMSTGSPLAHESFDYIYRDIKTDVCLSSISGGTDIMGCFALGNPCLPVYRGELQCLGLGMDVSFVDDNAQPLSQGKGELICSSPFPSMPTGFWKDHDNRKYRAAYFERFKNVWAHGDYGELIPHINPAQRGVIIHGRADAVLNPGGVRIGTAEIYRQVEKIPQVLEAMAIGQQWQDDVRVILFVVLQQNVILDESLEALIRHTIKTHTTPRHVPAKIIQVPALPRTISGKIVELAVRNVVHGLPVKNSDALANPEALKYFENLPQLHI